MKDKIKFARVLNTIISMLDDEEFKTLIKDVSGYSDLEITYVQKIFDLAEATWKKSVFKDEKRCKRCGKRWCGMRQLMEMDPRFYGSKKCRDKGSKR